MASASADTALLATGPNQAAFTRAVIGKFTQNRIGAADCLKILKIIKGRQDDPAPAYIIHGNKAVAAALALSIRGAG